jgi:hypothetical protein
VALGIDTAPIPLLATPPSTAQISAFAGWSHTTQKRKRGADRHAQAALSRRLTAEYRTEDIACIVLHRVRWSLLSGQIGGSDKLIPVDLRPLDPNPQPRPPRARHRVSMAGSRVAACVAVLHGSAVGVGGVLG